MRGFWGVRTLLIVEVCCLQRWEVRICMILLLWWCVLGFFAAPSPTSGRSAATFREGGKHRETRSRQYPSSARSQSTSGGSSSGRCCGSAQVAVCHSSVGPLVRPFEGSTESRAGQIQGAASGGQGGVMQVVHGTCPALRHTCRRGALYVAEVEEAQQRLLSLQEDGGASIPELQKQIEELVRERDFLRQGFRTRMAKETGSLTTFPL